MTQHQQPRDAYLSLRRFQTYFRDVIEPAVWSASVPIAAEVHQIADPSADPITAEAAASLEYRSEATPWRWGPKWSTAWFRVRGEIPAAWKGRAVALRFSSGTEGLIWRVTGRDATPATALQGLDVNRDAFHLTASAAGGEPIEALIEAACNHPFGVTGFEWDVSEVHQRWNSPDPGLFDRCELAAFEPAWWELRQRYAFALRLLEELPLDSNRGQELIAALRRATNAIPPSPREGAGGRVGDCADAVGSIEMQNPPPNPLPLGGGAGTPSDLEDSATSPAGGGGGARALDILGAVLASPAAGSTTRCFAVGHAHLDTAWLWPIRETKRKVLRTFSNQLGLMERFPRYVFLASQTQHYAWVEQRDPALFQRIRQRVAEGRWEPGGGMWIEPDVNCVSGESLVRQMLHADRWWRSRFGERGRQRFLFLPDTFGFGSNLPQLMRLAGLDTFITNKLHWWQHTTFPFTTFVWRGIDGSAVLGHNTPGQDYNAVNTPKELRRGEATHRNKSSLPLPEGGGGGEGLRLSPSPREGLGEGLLSSASSLAQGRSNPPPNPLPLGGGAGKEKALWLQPFGYGDGGGGATDWSIRFAEFAADCDGVPKVEFASASAFCDALHAQHRAGAEFPEWLGELDMEMHRGTLTSQSWIKKANRQAEESLRLAEMVMALLPLPEGGGGGEGLPSSGSSLAQRPSNPPPTPSLREGASGTNPPPNPLPLGGGAGKRAALDLAWKLALLNQFHDILPGSSIGWVYEDARKNYAEIERLVRPIVDRGLAALASDVPMVLNPTSRAFTGVVDVGGEPAYVVDVPPLGVASIVPAAAPEKASVVARAEVYTIKNHLTAAELASATGDIQRFSVCKRLTELLAIPPSKHGFNLLSAPAGLRLYEDRPIMWDAWDIDHYYVDKPIPLGALISTRVVENHPLRSVVETVRQLSPRSTMTQRATLHAGSGRLDLHFSIEWHEAHQLLRFEIPTSFGPTAVCTHGVHLGHQTRPTHRNTAHERARFEFPVQGWLDVSEHGRGLAVLTDCKFGFSCWQENGMPRIGVSLLRAPTHPDPQCDQGRHEFTISLLPHGGDWRAEGVVHQSELLRSPPRVIAARPGAAHDDALANPLFTILTPGLAAVTVAAIKPAEDSDDLILRLHECHGASGECHIHWHGPARDVALTDLLERTEPEGGVRVTTTMTHAGNTTTLHLNPFEIVTLRVGMGRKIL